MRVRKSDRTDLLRSVWLFKECSLRELDRLATCAAPLDVGAGRRLVREGDARREFIVIVSGKAEVVRNGRHLAFLGPGDFVGEMSLLDRREPVATVTTTEPSTVLVMTAASFGALLVDVPSLARNMLAVVASRLRDVETRYVTPKVSAPPRAR